MKIKCPQCGIEHDGDQTWIGKEVRCEGCGGVFTVENPNLVPCPDCFALISKRASVCPHCGAPLGDVQNQGMEYPEAENALGRKERVWDDRPPQAEKEETLYEVNPAAMYFFGDILLGILLIPVLIGIFMLINALIEINCTLYTVTTKRVIVNTGWLNKKQVEIWIKDMRAVNIQRSLWERIVGVGSVSIGTAATAGTEIGMRGLNEAQEIVDAINRLRG